MRFIAHAGRVAKGTIVALLLFCAGVLVVLACSPPNTQPHAGYTWAPGSWVRVQDLLVPSGSVDTATYNWNSSLSLGTCNSPSFSTSGGSGPTLDLSYAPLESPPGVFKRGETFLNQATYVAGRLYSVGITINSNVINSDTITEVLAHEMGHTVGLAHCSGCPFNSSVVVDGRPLPAGSDPWSFPIGLPGPTYCGHGCCFFRCL
jgi:hypothetical protein